MMDFVDPTAAERVLRDAWGIAIDVSKKRARFVVPSTAPEPTPQDSEDRGGGASRHYMDLLATVRAALERWRT
jgi:hypothetical protein